MYRWQCIADHHTALLRGRVNPHCAAPSRPARTGLPHLQHRSGALGQACVQRLEETPQPLARVVLARVLPGRRCRQRVRGEHAAIAYAVACRVHRARRLGGPRARCTLQPGTLPVKARSRQLTALHSHCTAEMEMAPSTVPGRMGSPWPCSSSTQHMACGSSVWQRQTNTSLTPAGGPWRSTACRLM